MRQKLFLGSSREAIHLARAVQAEMDDDFDVTVWNQGVFRLTRSALDSLLEALESSDAGVFILRPDDVLFHRTEVDPVVRDNVLFELGMFVGRLGPDRTFMLTPRDTPIHIPSDLIGLTTAGYDPLRANEEPQAAIGPACTHIRAELGRLRPRLVEQPASRARLDGAMTRMSNDFERLFAHQLATHRAALDPSTNLSSDKVSMRVGSADIEIVVGRIEDENTDASGSVVALPANEYFDDACITDQRSSLGAFVQHAYGDRLDEFTRAIKDALVQLPSQRVERAERRVDDSYGIGQAIFLGQLSASHRVILVSATTERVGIGLRAEPHFLYAAVRAVFEAMNANRLDRVSIPVFGAGHGGIPVTVALLFNVLALQSLLRDPIGVHVRCVRVVVFQGDADEHPGSLLRYVESLLPD
jgi:O-acetyl-ADP-ribose deacetylase (regulator of RNase III)